MLGLICDPVAARVEVPCLGKNIIAASNAFSCANVALAGYDQVLPFDEGVDAARRVSEKMPREHRCTSLGGRHHANRDQTQGRIGRPAFVHAS